MPRSWSLVLHPLAGGSVCGHPRGRGQEPHREDLERGARAHPGLGCAPPPFLLKIPVLLASLCPSLVKDQH
jgi:hypothetical protein